MQATAHPDDENNGLLVHAEPRPGLPDGAGDGDPRQRRTERDRPRDLRGARRPAHRGAGRAAPLRRRRAVLHAGGRLRLLVQHRRDVREVGPRRDHRRLRAADSHDSARRHDRDAADGNAGGQHHRRRPSSRAMRSRRAGDPTKYPEQIEGRAASLAAEEVLLHERRVRFSRRAAAPAADQAPVDRPGRLRSRCSARPTRKSAREARSMHKCQGMAQLLALPGPAPASYQLVETTLPGQIDRTSDAVRRRRQQHLGPREVRRRAAAEGSDRRPVGDRERRAGGAEEPSTPRRRRDAEAAARRPARGPRACGDSCAACPSTRPRRSRSISGFVRRKASSSRRRSSPTASRSRRSPTTASSCRVSR